MTRRPIVLLPIAVVLALTFAALVSGADETVRVEADRSPSTTSARGVPPDFENTAAREGEVVRMNYRTRSQGNRIGKYANVYLPAGYDQAASRRYDVLYLMHGGGQTAETFLGSAERSWGLKNMLDHMIEAGRIKPMIVVAPSFYPTATRASTSPTSTISPGRSRASCEPISCRRSSAGTEPTLARRMPAALRPRANIGRSGVSPWAP